jgi:hypothetical protein
MHCKICRLSITDPRFERDPTSGEPLYFRDPRFSASPAVTPTVTEIFCSAAHSYLDYLKSKGHEVPDFLLAKPA